MSEAEPTPKDISRDLSRYSFPLYLLKGPLKSGRQADRLPFLDRRIQADKKVSKKVSKIVGDIKQNGSSALLKYAAKFDGVGGARSDGGSGFRVPVERIKSSASSSSAVGVDPVLLESLKLAEQRIRNHYLQQKSAQQKEAIEKETQPTENIFKERMLKEKTLAIDSAGIYIPGGGAIYPSSVLMNVIPAQVAGVKRIIICTPPAKNSPTKNTAEVPDEVLAAAQIVGVEEVYGVGGAQAIAAMAYGAGDLIPKVDLICGPGNDYVAQALRLVSQDGSVRVPAAYAGPSEVAIIADMSANFSYLALDILAQMEHGVNGWAWVVAWNEDVFMELSEELNRALNKALMNQPQAEVPIIYGALVADPTEALELINLSAPEHLQIVCEGAEELAEGVRNAGAVFCGDFAPTAFGDYMAGPSHTLPTAGTARFSGALGVADFTKTVHIISATQEEFEPLGESAAIIADAEGLTTHAKSLRARLADKQPPNKGAQPD